MLCALATGELSAVGRARAARRAGPSSWRAPTPQDLFAAPPSCVGGSRRSAHGCWSILDASKRLLAGVDLMNMLGRRGAVERLAEGRASAGLPPKGWCWDSNGGDAIWSCTLQTLLAVVPSMASRREAIPFRSLLLSCMLGSVTALPPPPPSVPPSNVLAEFDDATNQLTVTVSQRTGEVSATDWCASLDQPFPSQPAKSRSHDRNAAT